MDDQDKDGRRRPDDDAVDVALSHLLHCSVQGCAISFERLYDRTHRRLFGVVHRIVLHGGEAEEILQDVYLRIWKRGHQFDPTRGLVIHWLSAIAHRAAIDSRRRSSTRPSELTCDAEGTEPFDRQESQLIGPAEAFEAEQREHLVHLQFRNLPLHHQQCLQLAFFDGLSHAEIATRLACPLGTAKSRVRRALMSMRHPLRALNSQSPTPLAIPVAA